MALWARAQTLPIEILHQVKAIYGEHFPIEVRHFLAPWLEEKISTNADSNLPQSEQHVALLANELIQELEKKAASMESPDMFITKMKLIDTANMFKQRYSNNPGLLFRQVRHCLNTELKLVEQGENVSMVTEVTTSSSRNPGACAEIAHEIGILRQKTQQTGDDLRRMEQDQEAFALHYHECTKTNAQITHLQSQPQTPQTSEFLQKLGERKRHQEQRLNLMFAGLMQLRLTIAEKFLDTVNHISKIQARVLDEELISWKREQQLAGNGAPFHSTLDNIQEWCESLAEIIWSNRHQIKELERLKQKLGHDPPTVSGVLPDLNTHITQLLSALVTSTFIVENQPPQVIKKDHKFTSTVRLLVGGKLNVHMTPPQVKVTIISEAQAKLLLTNDKICKNDTKGEIINSSGTMEYHQATRQLAISFRNMQLKMVKRAEKKGSEKVLDEKCSLLFQSQFSVGGGELVFQVWTLSLPVVVTVHGSQYPQAWATVTWDNAFAEPGRVPFAVPDQVTWSRVAEMLDMKFRSVTGRSLTEENLRFLAEKAFRTSYVNIHSSMMLSWSKFCKEPLPDRGFTFWEWCYAVMKLINEQLRDTWSAGLIIGFIHKRQAEEFLLACPNGTFLLRFSDSELGGVTIAVVRDGEVFMLQPFLSKDFEIRSLSDRISDLADLVYLYPDILKNDAFGKFYSPRENKPSSEKGGYVKPLLVTTVPDWGSSGQNTGMSNPNTPQSSYFVPSPDPYYSRDTSSINDQFSSSTSTGCQMSDELMKWVERDLPATDDSYDEFPINVNNVATDMIRLFDGVKINNFDGF